MPEEKISFDFISPLLGGVSRNTLTSKSELEKQRYKQDTELKREMAAWVKLVVSVYLIIVMGIVVYSLYLSQLSDAVMITLLTTTTVNVLGLSYMVVRHLFPDKEDKDADTDTDK